MPPEDFGGDLIASILLDEMRRAIEENRPVVGNRRSKRSRSCGPKAKSRVPETMTAGRILSKARILFANRSKDSEQSQETFDRY